MKSLAFGWWIRASLRLSRWSPLLGAAWADGFYLTAWPVIALLLPAIAFSVGLQQGVTHWSVETLWDGSTNPRIAMAFVQMVPLLYAAAILGSFSAQLGLLLVAGFALGDWFFANAAFQYPRLSPLEYFIRVGAPKIVCYGLFLMLAVQPILVARMLVNSIRWPARRMFGTAWFWLAAAVTAGLQGLIVYAWTTAAPMVVRPIWIWAWHGEWPPLTTPYFMQMVDPTLPIFAAAAALARAGLTWRARRSETAATNARALTVAFGKIERQPASRLPAWVGAALSALAITLLLGGFFGTLSLGISVFIVLAGILIGVTVVLPKLPAWIIWTNLIRKIPVLFRWSATIVMGYYIASLVYRNPSAAVGANQMAGAFGPELLSIVLGLVVATLLLSDREHTPPQLAQPTKFGISPKGAAAVFFLLVELMTATPASAYCADSFCCFVSNNQAILTVAALLLLLAVFWLGAIAVAGVIEALAELDEAALFEFFPKAGDFAGSKINELIADIESKSSISTAKPWQATAPRDLNEQVLWNEIKADPSVGRPLGLDNDARFPSVDGWQKMEVAQKLPDGTNITVHYQYNDLTGSIADPKIVTPQRVPPVLQPGRSIENMDK